MEVRKIDLPPNCWQYIMYFLTPPDLRNLARVNKKLNKIEKKEQVWERHCTIQWIYSKNNQTWKQLYFKWLR